MTRKSTPRLSVSTWSLHQTLGSPSSYGPGETIGRNGGDGGLSLLELPAKLRDFGIGTLEICHFHLASYQSAYLIELRERLEAADIELFSLLVDGGDITDPDYAERDLAWIAEWINIGEALGASCVRVIAGKAAPSDETIAMSRAGLRRLTNYAMQRNVRLMTENWLGLMSTPEIVVDTLEELDGKLGLCADFGNWRGPNKYADLEAILPYAESCHAKCAFSASGEPDMDDFTRCLELAHAAGFSGPYTLIYDGPRDNEWAGLALERDAVMPYLGE